MILRELTETKTVEVQGCKFTIGMIPRKTWKRLASRLAGSISLIQNDAGQVDENVAKDLKRADVRQANEELMDVYWEMVKHGVKGHSGIFGKDGEIKCQISDGCISESMIELYDLNNLMVPLASEILSFNTLTDEDKKKL